MEIQGPGRRGGVVDAALDFLVHDAGEEAEGASWSLGRAVEGAAVLVGPGVAGGGGVNVVVFVAAIVLGVGEGEVEAHYLARSRSGARSARGCCPGCRRWSWPHSSWD